jgi:hypothetical protein
MKSDNMFIIVMVIGIIVILGTGAVRAATVETSEFCVQNTRNPFCSDEGLGFEKPFTVESAHITLIETCDNT